MIELLTPEELTMKLKDEARFRPVYWGDCRNLFTQAAETIESQQAQIKGLMQALETINHQVSFEHDGECTNCGYNNTVTFSISERIQTTLSTLPAELLEYDRNREAVVSAALALELAAGKWESTSVGSITDQSDQYLQAAQQVCKVVKSFKGKRHE